MRCFFSLLLAASAAAGALAAAFAAIRAADAFYATFFCFPYVSRRAAYDQAYQRKNNDIFHRHLPFS